jgi:hypothetical protein
MRRRGCGARLATADRIGPNKGSPDFGKEPGIPADPGGRQSAGPRLAPARQWCQTFAVVPLARG